MVDYFNFINQQLKQDNKHVHLEALIDKFCKNNNL